MPLLRVRECFYVFVCPSALAVAKEWPFTLICVFFWGVRWLVVVMVYLLSVYLPLKGKRENLRDVLWWWDKSSISGWLLLFLCVLHQDNPLKWPFCQIPA